MSAALVTTIRERCRVCYTCVRECPAKAIRISGGQAEVISERCIGCGNCVRVCSQQAKKVRSSLEAVVDLLDGDVPVAACLAPSFPVEFGELPDGQVVGALRAAGFGLVCEVAFGADLVAARYRALLQDAPGARFISTPCPAVVGYVERYRPAQVEHLAPVVSPMIAMARVLRRLHGEKVRVVFIGPCIAKKAEADDVPVRGEVDAVLTFCELRALLDDRRIEPADQVASEFDPPLAGFGRLFPVGRGLLYAAGLEEDLLRNTCVTAQGRTGFVEAIDAFAAGNLDANLLDVLCCDGCIDGPRFTCSMPSYARRSLLARRMQRRLDSFDWDTWHQAVACFADLDLSRRFQPCDQHIPGPSDAEIREILARMGKHRPQDELDCGACGYHTCREHAIAIYEGLAESEMCLPYTIDQLRRTIKELALSHQQLARAQEALMHSERLASMGQLAAGIAHEVNNPLGVVLMYAHLLRDSLQADSQLRRDLDLIAEQADRCKKIVSGLLNFARQQKVVRQRVDLGALVGHVMDAVPAPHGIQVRIENRMEDAWAEIDRDQMTQVLLNLISNAYDAMQGGGTLTVRTTGDDRDVCIQVSDTGTGIPEVYRNKVFEPFFTTKSIGRGTGLGLAVTYGIVKMHCGDIQMESNPDPDAGPTGTTFSVTFPRHAREEACVDVRQATGG